MESNTTVEVGVFCMKFSISRNDCVDLEQRVLIRLNKFDLIADIPEEEKFKLIRFDRRVIAQLVVDSPDGWLNSLVSQPVYLLISHLYSDRT